MRQHGVLRKVTKTADKTRRYSRYLPAKQPSPTFMSVRSVVVVTIVLLKYPQNWPQTLHLVVPRHAKHYFLRKVTKHRGVFT
jgi:hypothetical protein